METVAVHRPRNVDWKRAAALLYGDWGTSKAYVIGLAFFFAGYGSFPIIVAVCLLTALVGYNYIIVCKNFPDGGGVYSAARTQSRLLAVVGALLLVANFIVTAALSCNAAMTYFGVPPRWLLWSTMFFILVIGAVNYFGPKHTGSMAMWLALPTAAVVAAIVLMSLPHLTTANMIPPPKGFWVNWKNFVSIILALSGVEAIANLTGVMKLDPGATMEKPRVARTATLAILPVAVEVVLATIILGWAMLSLPHSMAPDPVEQRDYMLRYLGAQYAAMTFGPMAGKAFGIVVGAVMGLLLLSAVNTAIAALIGLVYMLAKDGEMPRPFTILNKFGVPWWPWILAATLPVATVVVAGADLETLARFYAIGVVGAITVNLGSCTFNRSLEMRRHERLIMGGTFLILLAVELTIARINNDALFFAMCVVGGGLTLRTYTQRRAGLRTVTVPEAVAERVAPEAVPSFQPLAEPGKPILVAARGVTPVLRFALEEAKLRNTPLYVLYVNEVALSLPGVTSVEAPRTWKEDPNAARIMTTTLSWGQESDVKVLPLYAVSDDPATTILDIAATVGADMLILGAPQRQLLVKLLKGNVVTEVARHLPENIQLVIYG
ncbi:MAG: amino acid permease [Verrucomicrobia bacterium]|nr:amino acid permease [Verrucomicrobiota bacterium]